VLRALRYTSAQQMQMKEEETDAQFDGGKKHTAQISPHPPCPQTPLDVTVTAAAAPTQSVAVEDALQGTPRPRQLQQVPPQLTLSL